MKIKVFKLFYFLFVLSLISCHQKQKIKIDNQVFFEIPDDLESCKTLNENAFLQFQNLEKELYVIILKENKKTVLKQLNLGNSNNFSKILKLYTQKVQSNYKTQLKQFEVKKEYLQKDKILKNILKFNIKNNFISYHYQLIVFENNGFFYEIYIWTLEDFETQNEVIIEKIIKSISK